MVLAGGIAMIVGMMLSVLALSSRFDGRRLTSCSGALKNLSVLALSSRFDGLGYMCPWAYVPSFQYSLCRVVLMVQSSY